MKFLCQNCQAKYKIADEKIAGRTLKMDCRRCGATIVIRGDSRSSAPRAPDRRASMPGPPRAPVRARPSEARISAVPPAKPTPLDQWHVAIRDVPVGPLTRVELESKMRSGEVRADALAWREGFSDWRPIEGIAELNHLLRRSLAPEAPAAAPPPKPPFKPLAPPPRPARRPLRPRREAHRPSFHNVVPLAGRAAAVATAMDPADEEATAVLEDQPTQVTTAAMFSHPPDAAAEAALGWGHAPPVQQKVVQQGVVQQEVPVGAGPAADGAFSPPAGERATPEVPASPTPYTAIPAALPQPPGPHPAALQPAGPEEATVAEPVSAQIAQPASGSAATGDHGAGAHRGAGVSGLPVFAWIGIAGASAFGITLALTVASALLGGSQPVADAREASTVTPGAPTPAAIPAPSSAAADETADDEGDRSAEADQAEAATSKGRSASRKAPARAARRRPRRSAPSTPSKAPVEAEDPRWAALAKQASGGPAPLRGRARGSVLDERRGGSPSLTEAQLSRVVGRGIAGLRRCYEVATRGRRNVPTIRVDVHVDISPSGRVSRVRTRGQGVGNMKSCIESSVRRWVFPRSGGASETNFPLVFAGTE